MITKDDPQLCIRKDCFVLKLFYFKAFSDWDPLLFFKGAFSFVQKQF